MKSDTHLDIVESIDWDEFFMRMVYLVSTKSKDRSTKIGAIIVDDKVVISTGYNGICRNINDKLKERNESPEKHLWFEHAERNAIFNCARHGARTLGTTMYTQGIPCIDCTRGIINSGIIELVIHKPWEDMGFNNGPRWASNLKTRIEMLNEANIKIRRYEKVLGIQTIIREAVVNV